MREKGREREREEVREKEREGESERGGREVEGCEKAVNFNRNDELS